MSDEQDNNMGPVMDATPEIEELSERPEIKDAAIDALYQKEREIQIHHFTEETRVKHLSNWQVTKYAEEQVAYGINYLMKVSIGDGHFIHIRAHQRQDGDGYDFYSLHEIIKDNKATCIFKKGDPLTYFNY